MNRLDINSNRNKQCFLVLITTNHSNRSHQERLTCILVILSLSYILSIEETSTKASLDNPVVMRLDQLERLFFGMLLSFDFQFALHARNSFWVAHIFRL